MLFALALLIVQGGYVDPDVAVIPASYIGRWAIDLSDCKAPGGDVVEIRPRHIDFYERHGVVDLLRLNEIDDVPAVHASMRWVEGLKFSTGVIRLSMDKGGLYISESENPDALRDPFNAYKRCPA
ncbi:hypothetical protein KZ810_08125 [Sphingomonas sp. RHCKR47]|uniref:hypothetical protein n=1 Tax=Sphingomonas citricola TaxID=2862498 RepID=UPI001CA4F821|nr:hypothetical protein [Sphingomonas citricola]MBW6523464.1 hypothetical protein [Sphingomonas citricola]